MIKKIVKNLNDDEIKQAFLELDEWMKTGVLKQDGIVREIHNNFEKQVGSEQSLRVSENAILYEASRRFVENLKKKLMSPKSDKATEREGKDE